MNDHKYYFESDHDSILDLRHESTDLFYFIILLSIVIRL